MVQNIKNALVSILKPLKPFKIIPVIKPVFFIYLVTGIVVGQIGILFTLVKDYRLFVNSLVTNLSSGNFYTFSIALLASSIAPLFIEYISEEEIKFKIYKIISLVCVIFFLMLPMTYFFSSLNTIKDSFTGNPIVEQLDIAQLTFYSFSIILSIYIFCITYLKYDPESYSELDDSNVMKLKLSVKNTNSDSKGNKI